jgi:hypothetical protein
LMAHIKQVCKKHYKDIRTMSVAQIVECLPRKHKALNSNPSAAKNILKRQSDLNIFLNNVYVLLKCYINIHKLKCMYN